MRGVRGHTAGGDVVLKVEFKDLKGLMCAKPILYEYTWFPTSPFLSLGIKDKLKLL